MTTHTQACTRAQAQTHTGTPVQGTHTCTYTRVIIPCPILPVLSLGFCPCLTLTQSWGLHKVLPSGPHLVRTSTGMPGAPQALQSDHNSFYPPVEVSLAGRLAERLMWTRVW